MENQEHAVNFFYLVSNLQPSQNFEREKAFLKENLICCISGTEGRRKLKFGEVGVQICQNFFEKKIKQKNFQPECPFKGLTNTTACYYYSRIRLFA